MGMPISLALRGREADDAPRPRRPGPRRWRTLREADRVFSTYRADSAISSLGRGEITLAECPLRSPEVLALGGARRAGLGRRVRRRHLGGAEADLDPSGVVKGWAARARRGAPAQPGRAPTSASPRAATSSAERRPRGPPWRIGIEHPHDPTRLVAVVPVRHRGRRHLRHRPPRRPPRRRSAPAAPPTGGRLGHRHLSVPDLRPTSRPPPPSPSARTPCAGSAAAATPRSWCTPTAPRPSSSHPRTDAVIHPRPPGDVGAARTAHCRHARPVFDARRAIRRLPVATACARRWRWMPPYASAAGRYFLAPWSRRCS